jgi:predicted phosphatase
MYKEIFSFGELLPSYKKFFHKKTIIFFDIQGVLIKNNNFHEALNNKKYEGKLKDLCSQQNENYVKIARFGRFFKSALTENMLPAFLKELVDSGAELCLLTFARYSNDREKALKNLKILDYFHRQIWAGGIDKGLLLVEYLKTKESIKTKDNGIEYVWFFDDKDEHLDSAKKNLDEYITKNQLDLAYELFCYQNNPIVPVNDNDFMQFWQNVIQAFKNYKRNQFKRKTVKKRSY